MYGNHSVVAGEHAVLPCRGMEFSVVDVGDVYLLCGIAPALFGLELVTWTTVLLRRMRTGALSASSLL